MPAPKILIVDDSPFDRMMLTRAFTRNQGADVALAEAVSADDAVRQIEAEMFDAIFLDINMPGDNGFSVLRAVRAREDGTWPLVFMLSSSDHPDDISEAYSSQATAYLCKPDDLEDIRTLAAKCLSLIEEVSLPSNRPSKLH